MQTINFSLLKPEEIHAFSIRILPIIEPLVSEDPFLTEMKPMVEQKTTDLSIAIGTNRSSKFTPILNDRDIKRDLRFLGFRNYVITYTYHIDENMVQAAQVLEKIIQTRGFSLHTYGYAEETSSLKSLIEDLKTPAAQKAIATINAQPWVEWVESAQKDFEAAYQQKVATEAVEDLPQATATRKELIRFLTRLLSYLDINSEIKAEKFKPVVVKLDEVIVDVMTIARSRKSKANNVKDEVPL
ncbi:hypothetical protein JW964_28250 [candidate division KSB1 bacterium]|nr:hypothetical protein [candidate division KSB1 bacterium]